MDILFAVPELVSQNDIYQEIGPGVVATSLKSAIISYAYVSAGFWVQRLATSSIKGLSAALVCLASVFVYHDIVGGTATLKKHGLAFAAFLGASTVDVLVFVGTQIGLSVVTHWMGLHESHVEALIAILLIVILVLRISHTTNVLSLAGLAEDNDPHPLVIFILSTALFVANQLISWWLVTESVFPMISGFFGAMVWLALPLSGHEDKSAVQSTDGKHWLAIMALFDETAIYVMAGLLSQLLIGQVSNHWHPWEALVVLLVAVPVIMVILGGLWTTLKGQNLFRSAGAIVVFIVFSQQSMIPDTVLDMIILLFIWIVGLSLLGALDRWSRAHLSKKEITFISQITGLYRALLTAFTVQILTDRLNTRLLNWNPSDAEILLVQLGAFSVGMTIAWYVIMTPQERRAT